MTAQRVCRRLGRRRRRGGGGGRGTTGDSRGGNRRCTNSFSSPPSFLCLVGNQTGEEVACRMIFCVCPSHPLRVFFGAKDRGELLESSMWGCELWISEKTGYLQIVAEPHTTLGGRGTLQGGGCRGSFITGRILPHQNLAIPRQKNLEHHTFNHILVIQFWLLYKICTLVFNRTPSS